METDARCGPKELNPTSEDGWLIALCDACDRLGPLAYAGPENSGGGEGHFCLDGCETE